MKTVYLFIVLLLYSICPTHQFTISLTFSDGFKSHIKIAQILNKHMLNATFFINTQNVAFKEGYLNVFDVNELLKLNFEIGGHTLTHKDLSKITSTTTILEEICRDRARAIANGWTTTSFAYPYGKNNEIIRKLVIECGYSSALTNDRNTTSKAPNIYGVNILTNFTFEQLKQIVYSEQHKGWIILNFHDIVNTNTQQFITFITWLNAENYTVKSIDGVIQSTYKGVPEEFQHTHPTPTPDPKAELKIYIGSGCIGILILVIMYVVITTQLKKHKKIKFCC